MNLLAICSCTVKDFRSYQFWQSLVDLDFRGISREPLKTPLINMNSLSSDSIQSLQKFWIVFEETITTPVILRILVSQIAPHLVAKYVIPASLALPIYRIRIIEGSKSPRHKSTNQLFCVVFHSLHHCMNQDSPLKKIRRNIENAGGEPCESKQNLRV